MKNSYSQLMNRIGSAGNSSNGETLKEACQKVKNEFVRAMNDDFNTALAIASLFDLARDVNTYLKEKR